MIGCRTFVLAALTLGIGSIDVRASECYSWPLDGEKPAYDGDTIRIFMPGLPASIAGMRVRVADIDTPEIRGKCAKEKQQAIEARDFVNAIIYYRQSPVLFCSPVWGKYGGRVVADVWIDGENLAAVLIRSGLGRPYAGKARDGWCEGE